MLRLNDGQKKGFGAYAAAKALGIYNNLHFNVDYLSSGDAFTFFGTFLEAGDLVEVHVVEDFVTHAVNFAGVFHVLGGSG